MADTFDPKFGNVVALQFVVSNPDTGATNTDIAPAGQIGTVETMLYSGSVVGLAVKANANVTTATIAFSPHKDGTEYAQASGITTTLTTAAGSSNKGYSTVRPGVLTFAAGDGIGVSYSTATNYAATTIDYAVTMYVNLDPV